MVSESPEQCLGPCKLPSVLGFGLVLCRGGQTLGITRSLLVLGSVLEITRLPTPSQTTLDLSLGLGELPQRCVTWTPGCGGTESGRRQSVGGATARDAFFAPVFEASPLVLAASLIVNISLIPLSLPLGSRNTASLCCVSPRASEYLVCSLNLPTTQTIVPSLKMHHLNHAE